MNRDLNTLIEIIGCRELADKIELVRKNREGAGEEVLLTNIKSLMKNLSLKLKHFLKTLLNGMWQALICGVSLKKIEKRL